MALEVLPPPFVIADDDKRGAVVVVAATLLSFVWTCLLIRLWLRYKPEDWQLDDYFLAAATVFDTILCALIFRIVEEGLGQKLQDSTELNSQLHEIGKHDFLVQLIYILTLLLSKCGVLFLYLRLTPRRGHVIATWSTVALTLAWGFVSIILVSVPCRPGKYWPDGLDQCPSQIVRWKVIGCFDVISEVFIVAISVYLVAQLNMKTKSKILVVAAFSIRLPVIAASLIRLHHQTSTFSPSRDPENRAFAGAYYIIWTQVQLGYAVMSFTLTGMGPFLRPFTNDSSTQDSTLHSSSGLQSRQTAKSRPTLDTETANAYDHSYDDTHAYASGAGPSSYQMGPLPSPKLGAASGSNSYTSETASKRKDSKKLLQKTSNINNNKSRKHGTSSRSSASELNLRPDQDLVSREHAVHGGGSSSSPGDYDERDSALSRTSDDSQRMIITKRTEFTVETDRASFLSGEQMQKWGYDKKGGGGGGGGG